MTKHHLVESSSKSVAALCSLALMAVCGCGSGFNATSSAFASPSATTTATSSTVTPTIEASPASIPYGGSATLTWADSGADSTLVGGGDVLSQDPQGSVAVMPKSSTTYVLYSASAGGASVQTADVVVTAPASLLNSSHADWLARAQSTLAGMASCGSGVTLQQGSESASAAIDRAGSSGSTCVVLTPVSLTVNAAEYVGNALSSQGTEIAYVSDTPGLRTSM